MKFHKLIPMVAALLGTAGLLQAGGEGWTQDFDAAKATAAKEKKDLLIDFTGSDWCGWCIKLKEEVFSQDAFKNVAPNDFVLVELDFPRKPENTEKQPAETKERNKKLMEEFGIQGFPTIILADAAGRPYAKTGYQEGGAEKYLLHLAELRKTRTARDEAFAKAAKAEGMDKAKALSEGLAKIDPELQLKFYKAEVEAILAADKDDTLGFGKRSKTAGEEKAFMDKFKAFQPKLMESIKAKDLDGAMVKVDEWIKEAALEGQWKQQALGLKIQMFGQKADHAGALKLVDEIIAVDPSTEMAQKLKEQLRPQIEKAIEEMKKEKESGGDKPAPKEEPKKEA